MRSTDHFDLLPTGPLKGLRVLDITGAPGLLCTRMLADAGADVIRVEPPSGDPGRLKPPFYNDEPGLEHSLHFLHFNSNKRGITLDIEQPEGQAIFRRLCAKTDILVETSRPGYLESLGLGYTSLQEHNADLIHTSITHFGHNGPFKDYAANDMVCFALGGLMSMSGEPDDAPIVAPGELAYSLAASYAAFGTAVAVFRREFLGIGQYVEVSVHEAAVHIAGYTVPVYSATGRKPFRQSWRKRLFDLYDVYPCIDGYARIFVVPKKHWDSLLDWLGHPPELASPLFQNQQMRWENGDLVDPFVEELCLRYTKDQLFQEGQSRDIAVSPVNTPGEFVESKQTRARGLFSSLEHPVLGSYMQMGSMHRFSNTPTKTHRSAPTLGQHNFEVYSDWLGMTIDQVARLKANRTI